MIGTTYVRPAGNVRARFATGMTVRTTASVRPPTFIRLHMINFNLFWLGPREYLWTPMIGWFGAVVWELYGSVGCTALLIRHILLPPSQNKCSFILFMFNVWPFVLFKIFLWLLFLLLLDDKTWIVLYVWLNIFKFFIIFLNKTDGQRGTRISTATFILGRR